MKALIQKLKSNDIFKAVASLFGANMFASLVGVLGSFLQGRFITAEELGFLKQFSIINSYLFIFQFGIFHAVERLYPWHMAQGEEDKAKRVIQIGNAWILIVCFPVTIVFAVLSVVSFVSGDWRSGLCWIVETIAVWTSMYGGFLSVTYRSGKEFQRMARASVANPIVSLLLMPFYLVQPFITMVLRNCTSAISTVRLHLSRPVKVKFRFNIKEWFALVKHGLPFFSAYYISTAGIDAIRGTLILLFLTTEQLGYWSFAYTCILLVLQLPTSITAVYVPRIISKYAETNRMSECLKVCKKPILAGGAILLALVPMGIASVHFLLPLILPNYVDAMGVIYILLLSVPLKLSDALHTALTAAKKARALNIISLVGSLVQIAVSLGLAYIGVGIVSFAIGFFCGYLCRTILLSLSALGVVRKEKRLNVAGAIIQPE